jgi:hypothetical protein
MVVVAHVALNVARPSLELRGTGLAMAASQLTSLTSLIEIVMMVLVVSWLVHDDPAADREAFWLTRPIQPRRLAAAKLTVGGAAFVLLPLAGALITMAMFRVSAYDMGRAAPAIILDQALWLLTLTAAATLTPSLTRYALVLVSAVAGFVLLMSMMIAGLFLYADRVRPSAPRPQVSDPIPTIAGTLLAIAVSLWVVLYQYRRRRAKRAAIVGVTGLLAVMTVPIAWPSHLRQLPDPDPGAWARDQRQVAAVFSPEPPDVSDAFSFARRNSAMRRIAAPVRLSGIPDDFFVQAVDAHSRLEVPGTALASTQVDSAMIRRPAPSDARHDGQSALQAALGNVRLARRAGEDEYEPWPVLLTVTEGEFTQHAHTAGRLTATLDFYLSRSTLAGTIPVETGRSLRDETRRLDIVGIERRVDGCTVMLREVSINPLFRRRVFNNETLVLRNGARGQAVQGDLESVERDSSSPMSFLVSIAFLGNAFGASEADGSGFGIRSYAYRYPSRSPSAPVIDAEWLAGAELVRVTTAYSGHVTRSLTIDDFRMVR